MLSLKTRKGKVVQCVLLFFFVYRYVEKIHNSVVDKVSKLVIQLADISQVLFICLGARQTEPGWYRP